MTIAISHRELRFTIGRALHAAGLAAGAVNPVRDVLVDAQAAGVDVTTVLLDSIERLPAQQGRISWHRDGDRIVVDAAGQPAFLVAAAAVDLAVVAVAEAGEVSVEIRDTWATETLAGLPDRGRAHGVEIAASGETAFTARRSAAEGSELLTALLARGAEIEADAWWRLYDYSNTALTPDSVLSRTHAGASAYDENGRVIGELGEDYEG